MANENQPIGISILTNSNRCNWVKRCIDAFLENCSYRPLIISIYDNGSTDDTYSFLQSLVSSSEVEYRYARSQKDLGLAHGTNSATDLVKDCEYAIHVESDFIHLTEKESGVSKDWLEKAIHFCNKNSVDYLYLRRMRSENESMYHFWSQWLERIKVIDSDYMQCVGFWWTNNPALRHNPTIYKNGCLPLPDVGSKIRKPGDANWTKCELEAKRPENTWIHKFGMFTHEPPEGIEFGSEKYGCGAFKKVGNSSCKYGFYSPSSNFCNLCDLGKNLNDLSNHEYRLRNITSKDCRNIIFTVDAGANYENFVKIVKQISNTRGVVFKVGVMPFTKYEGIDVLDIQDVNFTEWLKLNPKAVGLFNKVSNSTSNYYDIATSLNKIVVHVTSNNGKVKHDQNGYLYQDESWAISWLNKLINNKEEKIEEIKTNPLISILMPTYNRKVSTIKRSIDCITNQTHSNFELLVISDGPSEPNTLSLVNSYNDSRIRYLFTGTTLPAGDYGASVRQFGLNKMNGKYVCFIDDDNTIEVNYLSELVKPLEENKGDFTICRILHYGPLPNNPILPKVLDGNPVKVGNIDTLQVMVKSDIIKNLGWCVKESYYSDGHTFEKLDKNCKKVYVDKILGTHY